MDEVKYQAMLSELENQRNWALTRCAQIAAELAVALAKVKEMETKVEKETEE